MAAPMAAPIAAPDLRFGQSIKRGTPRKLPKPQTMLLSAQRARKMAGAPGPRLAPGLVRRTAPPARPGSRPAIVAAQVGAGGVGGRVPWASGPLFRGPRPTIAAPPRLDCRRATPTPRRRASSGRSAAASRVPRRCASASRALEAAAGARRAAAAAPRCAPRTSPRRARAVRAGARAPGRARRAAPAARGAPNRRFGCKPRCLRPRRLPALDPPPLRRAGRAAGAALPCGPVGR
jgi:hypothetical protein